MTALSNTEVSFWKRWLEKRRHNGYLARTATIALVGIAFFSMVAGAAALRKEVGYLIEGVSGLTSLLFPQVAPDLLGLDESSEILWRAEQLKLLLFTVIVGILSGGLNRVFARRLERLVSTHPELSLTGASEDKR